MFSWNRYRININGMYSLDCTWTPSAFLHSINLCSYMAERVLQHTWNCLCSLFACKLDRDFYGTFGTRRTNRGGRVSKSNLFPVSWGFNPLNPELNPICYLLALLGAHHFLHVSRRRVKLLTFRLLMSYIYGAPILDVSRSHTTQHSR